ncbi:hypothetical protein L6R49_25730 [Myxococcota bacterium]|nr:hypothetical protein [Myxococcota bacterium]
MSKLLWCAPLLTLIACGEAPPSAPPAAPPAVEAEALTPPPAAGPTSAGQETLRAGAHTLVRGKVSGDLPCDGDGRVELSLADAAPGSPPLTWVSLGADGAFELAAPLGAPLILHARCVERGGADLTLLRSPDERLPALVTEPAPLSLVWVRPGAPPSAAPPGFMEGDGAPRLGDPRMMKRRGGMGL